MVQAMINISEKANRILNVIKAVYGLKDKSETINFIAKWYAENRLEPELRPVYKNKSKK